MCKINWTEEEDKFLLEFKEEQKIQSWCEIGHLLNKSVFGKQRTGKQCRERYINHLKGAKKSGSWSQNEDERLFQLYEKYGSRWTYISSYLEGRSENSVKNRFYGSIRKMVRLLNRIPKEKGNKKSKPIKYESILRVIELADEGFKDHQDLTVEGEKLKGKIFSLILRTEGELECQECSELVNQIHKFNLKTRCFSPRKRKINRECKEKKNEVKLEHIEQEPQKLKEEYSEPFIKVQHTEPEEEREIEEQDNFREWRNLFIRELKQQQDELIMPSINFSQIKNSVQSPQELQFEINQLL